MASTATSAVSGPPPPLVRLRERRRTTRTSPADRPRNSSVSVARYKTLSFSLAGQSGHSCERIGGADADRPGPDQGVEAPDGGGKRNQPHRRQRLREHDRIVQRQALGKRAGAGADAPRAAIHRWHEAHHPHHEPHGGHGDDHQRDLDERRRERSRTPDEIRALRLVRERATALERDVEGRRSDPPEHPQKERKRRHARQQPHRETSPAPDRERPRRAPYRFGRAPPAPLERRAHLDGRLVAQARIRGKAACDHVGQHRRHAAGRAVGAGKRLERRHQEVQRLGRRDGPAAGGHLEENHAEAEEVAALIGGLSEQLLRGHVRAACLAARYATVPARRRPSSSSPSPPGRGRLRPRSRAP